MSANITVLTDQTFDEQVKSADRAVLVDFWAEWCGPCKMIAPILEEIAVEHAEKLTVAKLNVDDNPQIALRFEVMSIPTMILFKDGEPVSRLVGARPKGRLLSDLADVL
ncbi:MAG TPA: thioredoxin [Acidimicrobiales bacterium]|nr:thioredoxin [Acidimicrobiales bacterium]